MKGGRKNAPLLTYPGRKSKVARWHIFKPQNPNLINFAGTVMEYVGIFYRHLAHFTGIWYMLWPFGIFYGYFVYFFRFGMLYQEKSGNPWPQPLCCKLSEWISCSNFIWTRRDRFLGAFALLFDNGNKSQEYILRIGFLQNGLDKTSFIVLLSNFL
jgi:hypothetical protein